MLGTGAGGLMAFVIRDISNRFLSAILEFSAGLMTAVVCFELIPEAFMMGGVPVTFLGVFAGVAVIILIENMLKKLTYFKMPRRDTGLLKTGILMSIGIALHNLPEGFAVGSGFKASISVGLTITAAIIIHDVPEGVAMAVPMRVGGFSGLKAFTLTILSGVPMGIGAFFGALLGDISTLFISGCLGFAGGAMLYIVFSELITESKRLYLGRLPSIGNVLGIICGIIVSTYN
jgi:ZIP family zinc transporter